MAETAREYLVHRFRGDAHALRDRIAALQRGSKLPGPDAATSRRMAEACEAVASMVDSITVSDDPQVELQALGALVPVLEQRARENEQHPPVRAVYSGAATRIREVEDAERRARDGENDGGDDGEYDGETDREDDES